MVKKRKIKLTKTQVINKVLKELEKKQHKLAKRTIYQFKGE
jgi:hypothetical protein